MPGDAGTMEKIVDDHLTPAPPRRSVPSNDHLIAFEPEQVDTNAMPSTRASARLAKTKGKRVNAATNEVDNVQEQDDDYVESDEDKEPPRKRQRAAEKPIKAVTRKKPARGKQGRLAGLINMPIDIFTEVASHLLPGDIITLARSNKFFRNLLMHRSAIHIWHRAMKNVEGLPPCPPNMSEPHYLALLFSKTCSMCGAPAKVNVDPVLLVRLCATCRDTSLTSLDSVPSVIVPWIVYSTNIVPHKRRQGGAYVLRKEIPGLLAQHKEKQQSRNKNALEAWVNERRDIIDARRKQGSEITKFLASLELDRAKELTDLKGARQSEIKRRLAEMGWTEKDMEFGRWSTTQRAWRDLVFQAKPLTDRIWANIKPKLIPLLETNREERTTAERNERSRQRKHRLFQLFQELKNQNSSVLQLKAQNPVTQLSPTMPTVRFAYRGPFPDFSHTLEWPLVKNLCETDLSVAEMVTNFEEHKAEIVALIASWKDRTQSHFANRLRDAYDSKGEDLRPTITISNEGSDSPVDISDDLKLLLRADSFFYQAGLSGSSKRPLSYGTILAGEGLTGSSSIYYAYMPTPPAPNLDKYHWYPEAHEAAQQILADMGKPDTSYLAMKTLGSVLMCGRCHQTEQRNWEGMVQHYIEQKQLHAKVHANEASLSDKGVVYNDVHDPTVLTDRPMVTDYATKSAERGANPGFGRLQMCKVCEKISGIGSVLALEWDIKKHLRDVHGITTPKVEEHYVPHSIFHPGLLGLGGYDYDEDEDDYDEDHYDSDDGYDMGFGCNCPFHSMMGHFDDDPLMFDPGNMYDYGSEEEEEYDEWW